MTKEEAWNEYHEKIKFKLMRMSAIYQSILDTLEEKPEYLQFQLEVEDTVKDFIFN